MHAETRAAGKRVLVVVAGAAAPPGDRTPVAAAETPALDAMARLGRAGVAALGTPHSPWDGFTALLGLGDGAPSLGAAEASGAGIALAPGDIAWRADFVTLDGERIQDPFGGKVRDPDAASLLAAAQAATPTVRLHRLGGHRNLAVAPGPAWFGPSSWEMVGHAPLAGLPAEGPARAWFDAWRAALAPHDVNTVRVDLRENPGNGLWLHGGGPAVPPSAPAGTRSGMLLVGRGAATAGLAQHLGCRASLVEGDDEMLAAAALAAASEADLVVVRTETVLDATASPDESARQAALSAADARLVAPLLGALEEREDFLLAVASDCVLDQSRALSRRPVPFVVRGTAVAAAGVAAFTERACETGGYHVSAAEFASLLGI